MITVAGTATFVTDVNDIDINLNSSNAITGATYIYNADGWIEWC